MYTSQLWKLATQTDYDFVLRLSVRCWLKLCMVRVPTMGTDFTSICPRKGIVFFFFLGSAVRALPTRFWHFSEGILTLWEVCVGGKKKIFQKAPSVRVTEARTGHVVLSLFVLPVRRELWKKQCHCDNRGDSLGLCGKKKNYLGCKYVWMKRRSISHI